MKVIVNFGVTDLILNTTVAVAYCKSPTGIDINMSGASLIPLGFGQYWFDVPNAVVGTAFNIYVIADSGNFQYGAFVDTAYDMLNPVVSYATTPVSGDGLFVETIMGDGVPLDAAYVEIYNSYGVLAELFSDIQQTVPLVNPLTSNANGVISCYMANGNYQLVVTKAGYSERRIDIGFFPVAQNKMAERTVDANFTIMPNDGIIWVNASGNVVGTFPAIANVTAGSIYTVKNKSAFQVSFTTPDAALINGAVASASPLTMQGESMTFTHDGTGWQTV